MRLMTILLAALLLGCGGKVVTSDAGLNQNLDAGEVIVPDGGAVLDAGTDAGLPTNRYPDGGSMSRYWDGGTCAVKTNCPCFSSDDCGPGFTCVSEDNTGANVWCVPGARGDGGVGASCTVEGDCQSALCVGGATGSAQYCSALCDTAAECAPQVPRCTYVGFGVDRSLCRP